MRRTILILISALCISLCACGNTASAESTKTEKLENSTEPTVSTEPSVGDQMYEKYHEIIDKLESEDYDDVLAIVEKLKKEKTAKEAGDIADHMLTVDLNSDNFSDYFEIMTVPCYNGFGELESNKVALCARSKKYDEGYYIYSLDSIAVAYTRNDNENVFDAQLSSLLSGYFWSGSLNPETIEFSYAGKITDGKIVFISKDFVDSYVIQERDLPSNEADHATMTLKNGDEINRAIQKDYPY